MNASSIPRTKVLSKDIQDDGTLSVSSIEVDDLNEKTVSHNIVSAVPIIGNAPVLTLTGPLACNGNRVVGDGRVKYVASDDVLVQWSGDVDSWQPSPVLWTLPAFIAIGSVIRVKWTCKRSLPTYVCEMMLDHNGAASVSKGNATDTATEYYHDLTIAAPTSGDDRKISVGGKYIAGQDNRIKITQFSLCGAPATSGANLYENWVMP